ncbi:LysM peptidoglycan-binding domain-containing protein [Macrococcoides goetzii]|uniref:LysM peptidoglycan-binding domain-containing protein n=1 Tax=Macrococcus sp. PK TaxID=2801919 RepID=UPI001F0F6F62|nr:LysM peptidoglycan-binding domain-containing protein [Macrococcus sp. PK]MCH4983990.1 LysM peptidoglycan-binding domain-containing protein [Macrococcus sp. PK]
MADKPIMKYKIQTKYVGAPKYRYRTGKPTCVVLHDTGNDRSNINGEISWMSRNINAAFVHAWADGDNIIETADTNFLCWGAGPGINSDALQIELVHEHTKERFFESVDRWIFWAAYQLYYYDIKPSDATDDGVGTIWTHEAVSKFKGRTDHVDPMPYIKLRSKALGYEITWKMIYLKLVEYYNVLEAGGDTSEIERIDEPIKTKTTSVKSTKTEKIPNSIKVENTKWLSTIAKEYNVSLDHLIKINRFKKNERIKKGTLIYLVKNTSDEKKSPKSTYKVKENDTLWGIAKKHNLSLEEIKALNNLKTNIIFENQILKIKKDKVIKKKAPIKSNKLVGLKTKEEMLAFANASVGHYFDYDGAFKFQCFDWANAYWHQMFKHGFTGMQAANIPQNNMAQLLKEGKVYKFGGDIKMEEGDLPIWDWDPNSTEDFGHVAVAIKVGTTGMTVVEQNVDGTASKPVNIRTCNFNGVAWFIRPNFK